MYIIRYITYKISKSGYNMYHPNNELTDVATKNSKNKKSPDQKS